MPQKKDRKFSSISKQKQKLNAVETRSDSSSDEGFGVGGRPPVRRKKEKQEKRPVTKLSQMGDVNEDMGKLIRPKTKKFYNHWEWWENKTWCQVITACLTLYVIYTGLLGTMIYTVVFTCRTIHTMSGVLLAFGWLALVVFVTTFSAYLTRKRLGNAMPWVPLLTLVGLMILFGVSIPCGKGLAQYDYTMNRAANLAKVVSTDEAFPLQTPPGKITMKFMDSKVGYKYAGTKQKAQSSYCIAPIIPKRGKPPYTVNYWAIGENCCFGRSEVHCNGWDNLDGSWWVSDMIDFKKPGFQVAREDSLSLRESDNDIYVAKNSVFVRYKKSEVPEAKTIKRDCYILITAFTLGWPLVVAFFVLLIGVGGGKVKKQVVKGVVKIRQEMNKKRVRYIKVRNEEEYNAVKAQVQAHNNAVLKRRQRQELARRSREQERDRQVQDPADKLIDDSPAPAKKSNRSGVRQRKKAD